MAIFNFTGLVNSITTEDGSQSESSILADSLVKPDGTSITQLRLNPLSGILVAAIDIPIQKTIASDGTVFSTTESTTEKYPVTVVYSNGIDQIDISTISDDTFIWSTKPNVTLSYIDQTGSNSFVIGGFIGFPVNTYTKASKSGIDFTYGGTKITIYGKNLQSLVNVFSNYTNEQNNFRRAAYLANIEQLTDSSETITTSEQAVTSIATKVDLVDGRLTVVETDFATKVYVDSKVDSILDGAPGVLDTLSEIANALNGDPNYAGTIAGEIASKANIQDPTFSGTVTTDSITIDNNKIATTVTNANLELDPSGTGNVTVQSNLVVTGVTFTNSIASTVSGVNIQGNTTFTAGIPNFQAVSQTVVSLTGATGVVVHDLSLGAVFFHSSISANFTANFTNVPTTDDRGIGVALILEQGGTGYLPTAVQINGASATLRWAYDTVPTPSSNQVDTVSFTLLRIDGTWIVVAQHTNFA